MVQKASRKETFSSLLLEDIPDIVRGHEIWVEHGMQHISPGDPVACDLCFGHNMKSDKAVQVEKVTPAVFSAWGENRAVEVSAASDHLLMQFIPAFAGYHTIGVEYDGGILNLSHPGLEGPKYYQQYTKTILPVCQGNSQTGGCQVGDCQVKGIYQTESDLIIGHELEIIPLGYRQYKVGEHILLKVLYDGHGLPDATVYGIHTGNRENPIEGKTDQKGIVDIELEKGGKWMFKVGYRDPEKCAKGLYDKKVMTATFTIMDVGEKTWK
ncbi:DUF4198 domain-containing protein [Methanosarcina sp. T3]|uniref:DUF4198 domain-containing protein n=1 Tax=Methanosarcina sp. T3 TaxID=3439062 RepID=UPI003F85D44B